MAKPKRDAGHGDILRLIRQQRAEPGTEGTVTTTELAKIAGISYEHALRMAHRLVESGHLRPEKCPRRNIHGEIQRVRAFRVVA
jgi:CRP-like cAMP-binding protein